MAVESTLKERLVGAVVLVVLGVWLIPLFLSGPHDADDATIGSSRSLTLPVAAQQPDRTTKTIRLNDPAPPRPVAGPVTTPVQPVKSASATPSVAEPASKLKLASAPKSKPLPGPAKSTGSVPTEGWFVQLGSFSSEANAKRLAAQVSALGWDPRLSQLPSGGKTMHRVRVGPVPTRSKADALRSELAQRGFAGKVMNEG